MRRVRRLSRAEAPAVRDLFLPDRPGPLIGLHVLRSGVGGVSVDRFPSPRAALAELPVNYALYGEPSSLAADELRELALDGFIETPSVFEPLLRQAYPDAGVWQRVIQQLKPSRLPAAPRVEATVRQLQDDDTGAAQRLSADIGWIDDTWGGAAGLAASGCAWGAWVAGRLASVACCFFVGDRFEDVGIVTEAEFRGRSLALACAHAACVDIIRRGRTPSWSTSPDNAASLRVAEAGVPSRPPRSPAGARPPAGVVGNECCSPWSGACGSRVRRSSVTVLPRILDIRIELMFQYPQATLNNRKSPAWRLKARGDRPTMALKSRMKWAWSK